MKLKDLLNSVPQDLFLQVDWRGAEARSVSAVCFDSRKLQKDSVFVAVTGSKIDGHHYLEQAIVAEASAIVLENSTEIPKSFTGAVIVAKNTRMVLAFLAAVNEGCPSRELFTVAVTGTNGKTTIVYLIESFLTAIGVSTGVIGTIDSHLQGKIWPSELTTPDPLEFQIRLREFLNLHAKAVALEASSHALDQYRIESLELDCAIFTNLSRDHLDYHSDMEHYFLSKLNLFNKILFKSIKSKRLAIVNGNDAYAKRIQPENCKRIEIMRHPPLVEFLPAIENRIDYAIEEMTFANSLVRVRFPQGQFTLLLPLPGEHNAFNAIAAMAAALHFADTNDLDMAECFSKLKKHWQKLKGVTGRLERIENKRNIHVFVDFAHTDAALHSILSFLQGIRARDPSHRSSRIFCVFGCGGDRDRGKRPLMLKAALAQSDQVILTSDNPRSEDPQKIVEDILRGNESDERIHVEIDRRKAIALALSSAKSGDVVLIAGKGHENYQLIGSKKIPMSDQLIARECLT